MHTNGINMPHRANLVFSDEAWEMLQEIPKGSRSAVVSEAVISDLRQRRIREAIVRMDERRARMKPLPGSTEQWIREDRDSH